MTRMNVTSTEEIAAFIESEITRGDYASASEIVREALRLLRRERELEAAKLDVLRREIDIGFAQAQRGEFSQRGAGQIAEEVLRRNDA